MSLTDVQRLYCRYHGQFITVARRRYLGATEQHRRDIHATLAHYYLGTWSRGRHKPFCYSKKQLRCVSGTGKSKGKPRKLEDEADRLVFHRASVYCSVLYIKK